MAALVTLLASGGGLVLSGSPFLARGAPVQAPLTRLSSPLMNAAEEMMEMPAKLAEWGCDAELWQGLRSGGRRGLKKQASNGDEAGARARMNALRLLVKEEPKKAVPTPNSAKPAAGYVLVGALPAGFDQPAAEALIAKRRDAKISKDFETADALEAELLAMNVILNNRRGHRSWKVEAGDVDGKGEKEALMEKAYAALVDGEL